MPVHAPRRKYRYHVLEVKTERKPNAAFFRLGFVLFLFMVAGITFVWLRSATDRLNRSLQEKRQSYSVGTKQMENLRMELESYKNPHYITDKVTRMNLGLRPPFPGQVRRISMEGNDKKADYSIDSLTVTPEFKDSLAQQERTASQRMAYP